MNRSNLHNFHIPVLGLAYSIDTPIKVARFGISSAISIMDDQLIEKMRAYYSFKNNETYTPITDKDDDFRAKRITAYLNLVSDLVQKQMDKLRSLPFSGENDLLKYFELLPDASPVKSKFVRMNGLEEGEQKKYWQDELRKKLVPGCIDVNIMAKVDRINVDARGNALPSEYSDALAAFRGFANSNLNSSVVFSAGYNPRLYNYVEQFADFFPDEHVNLRKKIILKVSDYRSALVQGKIFAKKGLWISEFRIESGLNCGGHAFATDGLLLGPILEEFKTKRAELRAELLELCNRANKEKSGCTFPVPPEMRITVQGGIGTANENEFLLEHYELNGTGWGSPFLLVPEATNVDETTINDLATAEKDDYYMSQASPLGIPFNNFRKSSAEKQRIERINKGRPGSPCYKKFLSSDTEFTATPICTASREYQNHKIKQLKEKGLPDEVYSVEFDKIVEKDCLCEGLGSAVLLKGKMPLSHKLSAVTICPGPNLAYFSGVFSLSEMVGHIYGRLNILNSLPRPNMFINELRLYIDHFRKKLQQNAGPTAKQTKSLETFRGNLLDGINYYKKLASALKNESSQYISLMKDELDKAAIDLASADF